MTLDTLKKYWRLGRLHLLLHLLKRRVPHAVLSWRYLLPKQSGVISLHRQVFLNAWQGHPRSIWVLLAVYSYTRWYFFDCWQLVWRVWRKYSIAIYNCHAVSRKRQFLELLMLALGQSTPPIYYYFYRLYQVPEAQWLNFIYTHELPHWHNLMSPALSDKSRRLMSHKAAFADVMNQQGLPGIPTLHFAPKGSGTETWLFSQRSLFIKPESGSRKRYCYELHYNSEHDSYRLVGTENFDNSEMIKKHLEQQIFQQDFFIQPLLQNHTDLLQWFQSERLITLRLVTLNKGEFIRLLCANLEVPRENTIDFVYPIPVNIQTGKLNAFTPALEDIPKSDLTVLNQAQGLQLPFWNQIEVTAYRAHAYFPDLLTIGWDFAITDNGIRILEGNINWNVAPHQMSGVPLAVAFMECSQ